MEKSIRIDPPPQPPAPESHWMMPSEVLLFVTPSTRVFQGLAALNRPPPPVLPPLDEELDEEEPVAPEELLDEDDELDEVFPLDEDDELELDVDCPLEEELEEEEELWWHQEYFGLQGYPHSLSALPSPPPPELSAWPQASREEAQSGNAARKGPIRMVVS
jgi:hypothetical protein